uniref:Uncharacterized protein n=1 Tax=Nelumbo nucifera TaxID=4432 RepID=A0A822XVT9_NELNU|nr:TPA_asm: hypothetical protein HUJ06_025911 [Nelumbo nucifera]
MTEIFRGYGLDYDMSGLTGNILDTHRLVAFARHQGPDKQRALVEEFGLGYFTRGKLYRRSVCVYCSTASSMSSRLEELRDPQNIFLSPQLSHLILDSLDNKISSFPIFIKFGMVWFQILGTDPSKPVLGFRVYPTQTNPMN